MRVKTFFLFIVIFLDVIPMYGQVPQITIHEACTNTDLHFFRGRYRIDEIVKYDNTFLINVTSVDSLYTNYGAILSHLAVPGVRFTVISFNDVPKNINNNICIDSIVIGDIRVFTLYPPGGVWTVFDCGHKNIGQTVMDMEGNTKYIPGSLIYTQLMFSKELTALRYNKIDSTILNSIKQ